MFLETVGERRAHQPNQSAIGMTGDDDVSDFQCSDAINKLAVRLCVLSRDKRPLHVVLYNSLELPKYFPFFFCLCFL